MNLSDFTFSAFMASVISSAIGIWLFREGRKRGNSSWIVIGLVMLVYTYFTKGPLLDWGIGALLCAAAHWRKDDD